MKLIFSILGLSVFFMSTLYPQVLGRNYGRSIVISQQGIAATSQVLASQTGAQILARGGSAVDAAIASNAVLAVTEPMMTGLGGDLFVMYWDAKTGKLTGLNASGPAPRALSPDFLAQHDIQSMPPDGIHTVTVPGAVEGWYRMHQRFGKLPGRTCSTMRSCTPSRDFPYTKESTNFGRILPLFAHWRRTRSRSVCFFPPGRAAHGRAVQESRHGAGLSLSRRTGSGCLL